MKFRPTSESMMLPERVVAEQFNSMAAEYDDLKDLWYSWLFSRLHFFITEFLLQQQTSCINRCLDVGCGTGFQSVLLSLCGKDVSGIDISPELVALARKKDVQDYLNGNGLFRPSFDFVKKYDDLILNAANQLRTCNPPGQICYQVGSACNLPYHSSEFDLVSCCGSTLSFIAEYTSALKEMARVLRSGGYMILEVENKYNPDLFWPLVDCCIARKIGYDQSFRDALRNIFSRPRRHLQTDFPFSTHTSEMDMKIWLFSSRTLQRELDGFGLKVVSISAIHVLTNLIPSVILDTANPSSNLRLLFGVLSRLEEHVAQKPITRRLGASTVYICKKGED